MAVVAVSVPCLKATLEVTSKLAPREVKPPATVKVLVPATVVAPLRVLVPDVVAKVPEPLKATLGLLVVLPMLMAVPVVPVAMLMAAAPPTFKLRALAPVVVKVDAPLAVMLPMLVRLPLLSTRVVPLVWIPPPLELIFPLAVTVPATDMPELVTSRYLVAPELF